MFLPYHVQEEYARYHHAELLREAQEARRAREARGEAGSSSILPRVFSWLGELAGALQQRSEAWGGKGKSLASKKVSYLDNPDPYKNCVTC